MSGWVVKNYKSYFKHNPGRDALVYAFVLLAMLCVSFVFLGSAIFEPGNCISTPSSKVYSNPDYDTDVCLDIRYTQLMGLSLRECDLGRRLLASIFAGWCIGYERASPERVTGLRTMSLVSLGACCYTLCSMFVTVTGPMKTDASRVAAALPSAVGFLGAGMIYKATETPLVKGLTTAASLWLSASLGAAAGARMYFVCAYGLALVLVILRFAPHSYLVTCDTCGSENGCIDGSECGGRNSAFEFDEQSVITENDFLRRMGYQRQESATNRSSRKPYGIPTSKVSDEQSQSKYARHTAEKQQLIEQLMPPIMYTYLSIYVPMD
ncbi:hypothetical protein SARC_02899 [Sphaeroforma arctica JP610]|uniref:MgtC/SapB/SrpB/YhiD N-terminal domain-containing protein n=1 Tax=Sphaeroforma arctica JP610 TaxID=667725 RepID=A0A0L0G7N2_9EUKA|nr:hypothetical protein SARC_02899 [Sphaeroforma arctica JP610]KNC84891.1 hypothetical protein SARC_02899 [Sphaeroforma arctica JP610]|eukprot:XP_014158793.1 hypothetical protein SARC_02899 [Sphaeroforma arctica JP610]